MIIEESRYTADISDENQLILNNIESLIKNCVKKNDVTEIRSLGKTNPPADTATVMYAVATVFNVEPSWVVICKDILNTTLYPRLSNLVVSSLTPAIIKRLRKYTQDPSFRPEYVRSTSVCL